MTAQLINVPSALRLFYSSQQRAILHRTDRLETQRLLERTEAAIERSYELIRRTDDLLLECPLTPPR